MRVLRVVPTLTGTLCAVPLVHLCLGVGGARLCMRLPLKTAGISPRPRRHTGDEADVWRDRGRRRLRTPLCMRSGSSLRLLARWRRAGGRAIVGVVTNAPGSPKSSPRSPRHGLACLHAQPAQLERCSHLAARGSIGGRGGARAGRGAGRTTRGRATPPGRPDVSALRNAPMAHKARAGGSFVVRGRRHQRRSAGRRPTSVPSQIAQPTPRCPGASRLHGLPSTEA